MEQDNLWTKLNALAESDYYPYHMPGHKRNSEAGAMAAYYKVDITEIDEFDNLHQPEGVLAAVQNTAAALYGAKEAYLSVNGSTAGILAAISAVCLRRTKILIGRNCHKSVYHGMYLQELEPIYLQPCMYGDKPGEITAEAVEQALRQNPYCKVVLITSPTYEGVVSDIEGIAEVVHSHDGILIVDQAHGAHFGLSSQVPESATRQGADLVIVSLHKTMPAMTQTALLLNCSNRVKTERLRRFCSIYQTSSPSYVLMASIEECLSIGLKQGKALLENLAKESRLLKEKIAKCRYLYVWDKPSDPGKLVIGIRGEILGSAYTGNWLYTKLREQYHLQMEMAASDYVLAIMTMMDTNEGWRRLTEAILDIDKELSENVCATEDTVLTPSDSCVLGKLLPKQKMSFYDAMEAETECVSLGTDAVNRTVADFVNVYPPGIPLLVPGEVLDLELVEALLGLVAQGLCVQGIDEHKMLRVIREL